MLGRGKMGYRVLGQLHFRFLFRVVTMGWGFYHSKVSVPQPGLLAGGYVAYTVDEGLDMV